MATKNNIQSEGFTQLNISSGYVTWRTTDTLKVKLVTSLSFNLVISNLIAGMSGCMILQVTSGTVHITLTTGKTNLGAGRLSMLTTGYYLFCFQYDGSNFFWNLARYE